MNRMKVIVLIARLLCLPVVIRTVGTGRRGTAGYKSYALAVFADHKRAKQYAGQMSATVE